MSYSKTFGLFLDPKLTFNEHIKHILSKVNKSIGLLHQFQAVLPRSSLIGPLLCEHLFRVNSFTCIVMQNADIIIIFETSYWLYWIFRWKHFFLMLSNLYIFLLFNVISIQLFLIQLSSTNVSFNLRIITINAHCFGL